PPFNLSGLVRFGIFHRLHDALTDLLQPVVELHLGLLLGDPEPSCNRLPGIVALTPLPNLPHPGAHAVGDLASGNRAFELFHPFCVRSRMGGRARTRSEEHTSELQSRFDLVCRLLLEKKKILNTTKHYTNSNAIRMNRSDLD